LVPHCANNIFSIRLPQNGARLQSPPEKTMLDHLIVYVEDKEEDVFFLKQALAQARHRGEFVHLSNVAAAMDFFASLAEEKLPSVILVDLHIGPDSGKDLVRFIRSIEALQKVPVISLSGSYVFSDLEKAYETGANLFLIKPTDVRGWTEMILKIRDYFPLS
jgi:CheY-like chemotaxis protein